MSDKDVERDELLRIAETLRTDKILTCERCGWELLKDGRCLNRFCFSDEHTVNTKVQMPRSVSTLEEVKGFMKAKGMKKDEGKQKWHALPLALLEPLADCLNAGVKKYAKFNCLQPFDDPDERFYDGVMRHLEECQLDPLAIDEETGCYHAAQIAFNTLMRLYHCKKIIEDKGYEHG